MGLHVAKEIVSRGVVIFQKVLETARGGFRLDNTGLTVGDIIPAGTVISFDESTRVAKVIKTAILHDNAANNAVNYKVKKGHLFKVGEHISATEGGTAYTITAISTANADYDQITVGTTLGTTLTAGAVLFQSVASGATASATLEPSGLLYEDTEVQPHADIAVVTRGTVYERRIPGVPDHIKSKMTTMIFSKSF